MQAIDRPVPARLFRLAALSLALLGASAVSLADATSWRLLWFGAGENTGAAADASDPDGDGANNADERARGSDPLLPHAPASAPASALPARLVSLAPEADGHVRSENPDTAYPSGDLLINNGATRRETYLRYDLSAADGALERAQLVFWVRNTDPSAAAIHVERVEDSGDSWQESTLAWTNKPASVAAGAVSFTGPFSLNSQRVLDVTSLVADTLANDPARKLGLRLFATGTMDGDLALGETGSGTHRRACLHLTFRAASSTPLRVMHVGDSITRGGAGGLNTTAFSNAGWRSYLHNVLLAQGLDFRAVGPRAQDGSIAGYNHAAELDRPMLFQHNAGYSGESIQFVRDNIGAWIAAHQPDLITLMIGTNNVGYKNTAPITQADIDFSRTRYVALLNNLFAASATAKVVMATIPPAGVRSIANPPLDYTPQNANRIEPFNTHVIRSIFTQFAASHPGRIFLVDNYAALNPADISTDGIHPSSAGHQKLARSWHPGLMQALGLPSSLRFANQGQGAAASLRGGINATTAFGAATSPLSPAWTNALLRVRSSTNPDLRAKSLLKFDLDGLPEKIGSAALGLVYHGASTAGLYDGSNDVVLHLYGVSDGQDSWTRTGVTWSDAPAHDTNGNGVTPGAATYLASVSIPARSRAGDLVVFRSEALRDFLTWGVGADKVAGFLLVAGGRSSPEVVIHGVSNADYTPPFLLVAPNAEATFSDWAAARLPASLDRAATADIDGDALPNLLEYALGEDPTVASPAALPRLHDDGPSPALRFRRMRREIVYEVQTSSDLAAWAVVATNPGAVGEEVTAADSTPLAARRFFRLRVTIP